MINRIAGIDFDSSTDDVPVAPSLEWSRLIWWMTPLCRVANGDVDASTVNFAKLREDIRASGILYADTPEWVDREGGLHEALCQASTHSLAFLREVVTGLYYLDEYNPSFIPVAVEKGVMFALVRRAHTLVTTLNVIEELITGVGVE